MPVSTRTVVLAALLVILAGVVIHEWRNMAGPSLPASPAQPGATSARRAPGTPGAVSAVPSVGLDRLQAAQARPAPTSAERNPFVFQPKAAPPPTPMQAAAAAAMIARATPQLPPGPPPPPPIMLKFIGIVQSPDQKLAVLVDSTTKDMFYGREGDIIDGRYRILRIGVESVEMAYVDGRGRQSLRLTGS